MTKIMAFEIVNGKKDGEVKLAYQILDTGNLMAQSRPMRVDFMGAIPSGVKSYPRNSSSDSAKTTMDYEPLPQLIAQHRPDLLVVESNARESGLSGALRILQPSEHMETLLMTFSAHLKNIERVLYGKYGVRDLPHVEQIPYDVFTEMALGDQAKFAGAGRAKFNAITGYYAADKRDDAPELYVQKLAGVASKLFRVDSAGHLHEI